ncbi:MAG: MarR family winged helix-turn-helix transcriptional regulator [Sphingomonas fennica]
MARGGMGEGTGGLSVADHWGLFGPDHLPYRILLLGRMLDRLTAQHVRSVGDMAVAEWRVLAHLAQMGERSASAVSAAALVERSEVSRAVARLTADGLVHARPNPANARSRLLSLTEAGRARFAATRAARLGFFATVMQGFTPDEAAALDGALLRIAQQVERMGQLPPSDMGETI